MSGLQSGQDNVPSTLDILKASAQVGAATGKPMPPMEHAPEQQKMEGLQADNRKGVAGTAFGGIAGLTRSTTPTLFAVASGLQWAAMGATFWSARQMILANHLARADHADTPMTMIDLSPTQRSEASAIAGGVTGFLTAAITRGRSNIIPGVFIFSLTGYLAQTAYNTVDKTRQDRDVSDNQDTLFMRLAKSRFSPMKVLNNEEYSALLKEKQIRIEAEIALIDDEIARLRQAQRSMDQDQIGKE